MSLSDLASLGSFVSGIAVVFSFIFLALQLRQANLNQRALMQQGRSARTIETMSHLAEPHILAPLTRGMAGDATLDRDQIGIVITMIYMILVNFEDTFLQFASGTLNPEIWEVDKSRMMDLFQYPGYRATWQIHRKNFSRTFEDLVDDMIRKALSLPSNDAVEIWKSLVTEELSMRPA